MPGTVIATSLRLLWRILERRGVDPASLFDEIGLDPEKLSDPRARYPLNLMRHACARASELLDDPAAGLIAAEVWQPTDFHALGLAFLASSTLRTALERLVRYSAMVNDLVRYSVIDSGDRITLVCNMADGDFGEVATIEDARWVIILDSCRRAYGYSLDPLEVTFLHADPGLEIGKFYGLFRCAMQFGAPVSSMTFPAEVIDRPLPASNRELAHMHDGVLSDVIGKLQRDDIVSRTKSAIIDNLPSDDFTAEKVANSLHMSSRNLQRKLAAENTTFRALVEVIRQELARSYLTDSDSTLQDIAFLLGFSSQAAFTRAFKRWTGHTPQEYRDIA
jgi:AraC-like DNA-binding protein